ncbi:DUF3027 domain-containing protein [Curtobacterium sp. SORGH_AS_0776]|uniref:DUF3027 domain-containing protein n=1 Tax=unclassified Curtobacterium TaxID=257496 RepID=UPI00285FB90C|nr:DUF3027 domain-containing protein [Curtobacterium sp. SORGH_AS_0776]MDR6169262.1 hypothetical protein [Curtobacterium sp. SORGH_AS_0776]
MTDTSPVAPAPSEDLTALARTALLEVTPESTVGAFAGTVDEGDGVVSVLFANRMAGYPGWRWTVSIAQVSGDEPTVLEVELMPGDGSLLAPDWVPWSERLAEYRAGQDTDGAEGEHDDESDEDDDEDFDGDEDDADEDADYDDSDDDESDDDEADDEDDFDADEDDLDEPDDDDIDGVDVDELDGSEDDTDDADTDDADTDDADQQVAPAEPAEPARGRRRTQRVRPVDPDADLEVDRLDAGEVDPEHHRA